MTDNEFKLIIKKDNNRLDIIYEANTTRNDCTFYCNETFCIYTHKRFINIAGTY